MPTYGRPHRRNNRQPWIAAVAAGVVECVFAAVGECLMSDPLILHGQQWDWDHTHRGPAHAKCNRSAGAAYGNRRRRPSSEFFRRR